MAWEKNLELQKVGESVLNEFHSALAGEVAFIFVLGGIKNGSKVLWGRASLISEKVRTVGIKEHFLIEVSFPVWNLISDKEKKALLDHELCHCHVGKDSEGKVRFRTRPHDFSDFNEVLQRHGLWAEDLKVLAENIKGLKG